jgi:catalase
VRSNSTPGRLGFSPPDTAAVNHPNTSGGPDAVRQEGEEQASWRVEAAELVREAYSRHDEDDDFVQPRALIRDVMDEAARERLVSNVSGHMSEVTDDDVRGRALKYWRDIDPEIGERIAAKLKGD